MFNDKLLFGKTMKSPLTEAFRTLRTNLQLTKKDLDLKKILFTSSEMDEGTSMIVANTGLAMAWNEKKVIIIDCNLYRPMQHHIFNLKNYGLTDYLRMKEPLEDLIQNTDMTNLHLLACGSPSFNGPELLDSPKMMQLIQTLDTQYDYVLLDTPAVLDCTDALNLATRVDGVILVITVGRIHPEKVQNAKNCLVRVGGRILGVILNRTSE